MELALKLASIFFTMILVDNYVLAKFLGICPFLGVSKKLDSAVGMSLAVTFVMVLATAATWPIQMFLLTPPGSEGTARDLGLSLIHIWSFCFFIRHSFLHHPAPPVQISSSASFRQALSRSSSS